MEIVYISLYFGWPKDATSTPKVSLTSLATSTSCAFENINTVYFLVFTESIIIVSSKISTLIFFKSKIERKKC